MKVRPLQDRVVIQLTEPVKQTASGLIIPDIATEKPETGVILAVGSGKRNEEGAVIPLVVEVGDTVLFSKGVGEKVKLDGQELVVIRESDIIGIIK